MRFSTLLLVFVFTFVAHGFVYAASRGNVPVAGVQQPSDKDSVLVMDERPLYFITPNISFLNYSQILGGDLNVFIAPEFRPPENSDGFILPSTVVELAKEIKEQIGDDFDQDIMLNAAAQTYLYTDISLMLLSYAVRQLTENQLDILLLTARDNEESAVFVDGIELGIRPDPMFGFRVRMRENRNTVINEELEGQNPSQPRMSYGMEVRFFPTADTMLKLGRDGENTELEFNMKF